MYIDPELQFLRDFVKEIEKENLENITEIFFEELHSGQVRMCIRRLLLEQEELSHSATWLNKTSYLHARMKVIMGEKIVIEKPHLQITAAKMESTGYSDLSDTGPVPQSIITGLY